MPVTNKAGSHKAFHFMRACIFFGPAHRVTRSPFCCNPNHACRYLWGYPKMSAYFRACECAVTGLRVRTLSPVSAHSPTHPHTISLSSPRLIVHEMLEEVVEVFVHAAEQGTGDIDGVVVVVVARCGVGDEV